MILRLKLISVSINLYTGVTVNIGVNATTMSYDGKIGYISVENAATAFLSVYCNK
jgi:hypothetical protein